MKKLLFSVAVMLCTTISYAQSLSVVSSVEKQPATTDFSAVAISNSYDPSTREFKVNVSTLGQTTGHHVAGFFVSIEARDWMGNNLASTWRDLANANETSPSTPVPAYTAYNSDYIANGTTYAGAFVLPANTVKVVYRVICLNDPDMDNTINSEDISDIEYTTGYVY